MFAVRIGHYNWLSEVGLPPMTASSKHARQFATRDAAALALSVFDADREMALRHESTAMRAHYSDPAKVPGAIVPWDELVARQAEVAGTGKPAPAVAPAKPAAAPKAAPGAPAAPAVAKPKGVTTLIREWVAANPQATKADTYAHFPDANRSTVNVQYGIARKGA